LRADLNWNVLAVAASISLAAGVLFGLAPALAAARTDLNFALKQVPVGEGKGVLRRSIPLSLNQILVVSQIAISLLLLVAAGLFVSTLRNLHSIALGFDEEKVLLITVNAKQADYGEARLASFYADLQSRLASLPGVRSASMSNYALVSGSSSSVEISVPGSFPDGSQPATAMLYVGPGFFTTMRMSLLSGHEISDADLTSRNRVAVVNEVFARKYLGQTDAVGRSFTLASKSPANVEVIGVVRNARYNSLKGDIPPLAFLPYGQHLKFVGEMVYELRTEGEPSLLATTVRQIVRHMDARVPVSNIVTQRQQIARTIGQERTFAMLCSAFAVLALLMACVGLYGTTAYTVARRVNEMGVRMALGAQRSQLLWTVLSSIVITVGVGTIIGLAVAMVMTRLLQSFLFELTPNDPIVLTIAAAILFLAALIAGYVPARRASRMDPCLALRHE
jgi:macrolide transport system ATP-binding/permease protein